MTRLPHSRLPDAEGDMPSLLQRRLKSSLKRNRLFFNLVRRKRSQHENKPSRLIQRLHDKRKPLRQWQYRVAATVAILGIGSVTWGGLFVSERVTLGGVPYRIVNKFWHSQAARDAYFAGDRQALHYQLASLGVEEDIKDYYRDRFDNEGELDRHIHQIMYNRTGYVGEAYEVDKHNRLRFRSY